MREGARSLLLGKLGAPSVGPCLWFASLLHCFPEYGVVKEEAGE